MVGLVLSEVQSLAAVVPLVASQGQVAQGSGTRVQVSERPHFSQKQAALGPGHAPLSASEFVKSYNSTLTAKTGNADLDRVTTALQIHLHGKAERWGSVGLLK